MAKVEFRATRNKAEHHIRSTLAYDANQTREEIVPLSLEGTPLGNMYTKEVEQFGDAVINDTEVPVTAESAILDQKVVEAAYKSSEEKKFVKIV